MALRGRELPGFSNTMFFRSFMAEYVETWRSRTDGTRVTFVEAVRLSCVAMMEVVAPAFHRFTSLATNVVAEVGAHDLRRMCGTHTGGF